ncbi:MAG: hypothetical protein AUK63_646 [bacterium P3]|nr:MAG: hypothetical protein AUK63_646 [bacterium P3]KWW42129.1 MAG: hypothetical protein F083_468 [bacterium F083]
MKKLSKKLRAKTILVSCIGFLMFISCSEKEDIIPCVNNDTKQISEIKIPFDYIGEQHNALLYSIGDFYHETLEEYAILADENALDAEMQEKFVERIISELHQKEDIFGALNISQDSMEIFVLLSDTYLHMDTIDKHFFNAKLGDVVANILANIEHCESIEQQREIIREKEFSILNHATCYFDTCVVITLNVFEHSLAFWDDAYNNLNNPWHNYLIATERLKIEIQYDLKSNVIRRIGKFFCRLKEKIEEKIDYFFTSNKIGKLAAVDAVTAGATALSLNQSPIATQPGVVLGGALVSGVITSAACGVLNWQTL